MKEKGKKKESKERKKITYIYFDEWYNDLKMNENLIPNLIYHQFLA